MDTVVKELSQIVGENRMFINESMKNHTTLKIGGLADYYTDATTLPELEKLLNIAQRMNISVTVLGGGTNCIISEKGIRGLVIKNNCRRFDVQGMKGKVKNNEVTTDHAIVYAESGAITNQLVRFTIEQGLSGLEYAYGLPGTIGGAVCVNANYPKEKILVGSSVKSARIMTNNGEIREVGHEYFRFGFDESIVNRSHDILLSILFQMQPMDKKLLSDRGMEAFTYRNETQPKNIIGGVTFRNMIVSTPVHNTDGSSFVIQDLFENANLKGIKKGGILLSEVNPRYIINDGSGTVTDIQAVVKEVKERIFSVYGAILHLEVKVLGEI